MNYAFVTAALVFLSAALEAAPKRTFEVNASIDPCEDFYEYACSKTEQAYKLREDRSQHVFSFNDSSDSILEAKKSYVAGLNSPKNQRQRKIRSIYAACMNEKERKAFEKEYVNATLRFIKSIPTLEKLQDFFGAQAVRGEEFSPIAFGQIQNLDDPSRYDVYLLSNWLSLPERTYYEKEDVIHDLISVAKDFFDVLKEPNAQQRAESVVQFQIDVSKTSLLPVELRDRISTKTSISKEEIEKKWPTLKLKPLLEKLPKDVIIRNLSPENFTWLQDSVAKVPLQVVKDAFLLRLLPEYMDAAYPTFYKKAFEFRQKHLGGPNQRPKKNEECTNFLMDNYGMELDSELLPTLFSGFPEARITALTERIRKAVSEGIEQSSWLSAPAKKEALDKIQKAHLHLVKPKSEKDWNFLPEGKFSDRIHYENLRMLNKLRTQQKFAKILGKRNPAEWEMGPLEINAYYSPSDNKFVLPIGILQPPFFDKSANDAEILGGIGSIIGHELGHAIDDKGSKFNAQGKLVRWMSDSDLEEFNRLAAKLRNQLDESELAGHLKIGEFIGDLVGVTFAYKAAFPPADKSVGNRKDFFLQYARVWCAVTRPQFAELLKKIDPHPPGKFRVNGTLVHLKEFQDAFKCKDGSKMTLKEKERVRVW